MKRWSRFISLRILLMFSLVTLVLWWRSCSWLITRLRASLNLLYQGFILDHKTNSFSGLAKQPVLNFTLFRIFLNNEHLFHPTTNLSTGKTDWCSFHTLGILTYKYAVLQKYPIKHTHYNGKTICTKIYGLQFSNCEKSVKIWKWKLFKGTSLLIQLQIKLMS